MLELWTPHSGRIDRSLSAEEDRKLVVIENFKKLGIDDLLSSWSNYFHEKDPWAFSLHNWNKDRIIAVLRWRDKTTLEQDEKYENEGIKQKGIFSRGVRIIVGEEGAHLELTRRLGPERFPIAVTWMDDQFDRRLRGLSPSTNYSLDERVECAVDNPFGAPMYSGERSTVGGKVLKIERQLADQHVINRVVFEGRNNIIR